jgi:hypothetical protein
MVLHGTIVLLIGLLSGFPYSLAIVRRAEPRKVDAWRAAHTGLCATGVMLIALGAVLRGWGPPGAAAHLVVWTLAGGSYCVAVAMTVGAATGARGLHGHGGAAQRLVFAAYQLGIAGTFVGVIEFLWLAWCHY